MEKFYLATAIAYASSIPHIGNVYEVIFADAIARYKRLRHFEVYFQTGTDEHGQKIENKAKENNISALEYVTNISKNIREIYDKVNISYDNFVRTSNIEHVDEVQKIFKKLYDQDDIYKGLYVGRYCVSCESFFKESDVSNNLCPDCGKELIESKEEAYFFRLSKYQDRLVEYINTHPNFIEPESRKNEMLFFLKDKLPDLCVSRSTVDWGIPLTFDESHTVYVWIDALINYLSGIGYDTIKSSDKFYKLWPCDLHIIGKDVLRFHVIYWTILLMALDLELPKKIFGHPWILADKKKMSKSVGNVMDTLELIKHFGVDAIRYYCLHEIPYQVDGNITYELIIERYNSDLVNTISNLVNRTISMAKKYFNLEFDFTYTDYTKAYRDEIILYKEKCFNLLDELRVQDSLDEAVNIFRRANKFIDETMPWVLAKQEDKKDLLKEVIGTLIETIRIGAVALSVFIPDTSLKIFNQINTSLDDYDSLNQFKNYHIKLNDPTPLFMRIDMEEKLHEIENK